MYLMLVSVYLCLFFNNFLWCNGDGNPKTESDTIVQDIAENLLSLFGGANTTRILELRDKLSRVDGYAVDTGPYTALLKYHAKPAKLNATNFYNALVENSEQKLPIQNTSQNLYLTMKQRMTRDDLLKVLADRGGSRLGASARRAIDPKRSGLHRNRRLNELVDKYLGEVPSDDHVFNDTYSRLWDPQPELEERRAYYQPDGRRLFRGERTTVRYYPFVVSLHVMGRFWCGGSIFWKDLIITSASCLQLIHNNRFFRENPKVLTIRVGSNHSRIGGEVIDALEVYFHPAYNPRTLKNNIALVRLARHLKFSYHRVPKTIEISTYKYGMALTEVLLLGWGVTKTSQKLAYEPIYLQRKMLPVYPKKFCQEVYGEKFITETMFCAGTVTTGEGACDHDAGGPAVMNGLLVGVISFGPTICGFPDAPTVFTLVGAYADWIYQVNGSMQDYYRGRKRTTTTTEDPFLEYVSTSTLQPVDKFLVRVPLRDLDTLKKEEVKKTATEVIMATGAKSSLRAHNDDDFRVTPGVGVAGDDEALFL